MSDNKNMDSLKQLLEIMRRLRDPEHGCPWDIEQTFASVAPHTLEETYEVLDAIERQDYVQLPCELGDLLFQVVFYAQLGSELQLFDFSDITEQINAKLLRRHPHVFPDGTLESVRLTTGNRSGDVIEKWEAIKADERQGNLQDTSILADIPIALTALLRAVKLQKRAARSGMDWVNADQVKSRLLDELAELHEAEARKDADAIEDELGDLLFTVVNLSRHLKTDPETALRKANRKFESRIRVMEKMLIKDGKQMKELNSEELDWYWRQAKLLVAKA